MWKQRVDGLCKEHLRDEGQWGSDTIMQGCKKVDLERRRRQTCDVNELLCRAVNDHILPMLGFRRYEYMLGCDGVVPATCRHLPHAQIPRECQSPRMLEWCHFYMTATPRDMVAGGISLVTGKTFAIREVET